MIKMLSIFSSKQENPSEEDAAIVDKILSSRIIKKEVSKIMEVFVIFLNSELK